MATYAAPHDPTAVNGRRFFAWILDGIIAYAVFAAVAFATVTFKQSTRSCMNDGGVCFGGNGTYYSAPASAFSTAYLVAGIYYVLVFWVLQGLTGASIGKFLCGIRVVKEDGRTCGILAAIVRSVLWIVDAAPWCVPLLGPILVLTTKDHRRVGDMAAGTYVVGKADAGRPIHQAAAVGYGMPTGYGVPNAYGTSSAATPPQPTTDSQWDPQRGVWVRYDPDLQGWYGLNPQTGQWYSL